MSESAFHAMEKSGWENNAAGYAGGFAALTAQSIAPLLDAVQAGPGVRLLDVACGPATMTAAAATRGARATGLDFSAAMLEMARAQHPGIELREGDATALPFADHGFDAVVVGFGINHLDQPERAMAEAARVLVPGGRFAFAVWAPPPLTEGYRIAFAALEKHGDMSVPLPAAPSFFHFADAANSRAALEAAGFADIRVETVPQVWQLSGVDDLFEHLLNGSVRTSALLKAQTPQALAKIRAAMAAGMAPHVQGGGYALSMPSVVSSGRKPG